MMISAVHLIGGKTADFLDARRFAGAKGVCPAGMRRRARMFWCPLIDTAVHVVSYHNGRTSIASQVVSVAIEDTRACRTAWRISSGIFSGLSMHDLPRQAIVEGFMYGPEDNVFGKGSALGYALLHR